MSGRTMHVLVLAIKCDLASGWPRTRLDPSNAVRRVGMEDSTSHFPTLDRTGLRHVVTSTGDDGSTFACFSGAAFCSSTSAKDVRFTVNIMHGANCFSFGEFRPVQVCTFLLLDDYMATTPHHFTSGAKRLSIRTNPHSDFTNIR